MHRKPLTPTSTSEPEKGKNKGMGGIVLLLIVGMAGGGIYYFKVLKNKPNTKEIPSLMDYDFEDDERRLIMNMKQKLMMKMKVRLIFSGLFYG